MIYDPASAANSNYGCSATRPAIDVDTADAQTPMAYRLLDDVLQLPGDEHDAPAGPVQAKRHEPQSNFWFEAANQGAGGLGALMLASLAVGPEGPPLVLLGASAIGAMGGQLHAHYWQGDKISPLKVGVAGAAALAGPWIGGMIAKVAGPVVSSVVARFAGEAAKDVAVAATEVAGNAAAKAAAPATKAAGTAVADATVEATVSTTVEAGLHVKPHEGIGRFFDTHLHPSSYGQQALSNKPVSKALDKALEIELAAHEQYIRVALETDGSLMSHPKVSYELAQHLRATGYEAEFFTMEMQIEAALLRGPMHPGSGAATKVASSQVFYDDMIIPGFDTVAPLDPIKQKAFARLTDKLANKFPDVPVRTWDKGTQALGRVTAYVDDVLDFSTASIHPIESGTALTSTSGRLAGTIPKGVGDGAARYRVIGNIAADESLQWASLAINVTQRRFATSFIGETAIETKLPGLTIPLSSVVAAAINQQID